jgi:phosphoribosyl-ATP pyrophosphohydrolase
MPATEKILLEMFEVIEGRKTADPETSYTARLFGKGTQKIAQKFGEEAIEAVVSAVSESQERLIRESADVLYHLLVMWADRGVKPVLVWEELEKRFGTSGLAVKEARKKSGG